MSTAQQFFDTLKTSIANNEIRLPTLPEVALRVRDEVENELATADSLANLIATDPALSARLLQVANSPLYRGRSEIDSVKMAVTRLGLSLVKNLVVSLAMKQMFQATSDALDRKMRAVWDQSVQVAAIARVLSAGLPHLDREQAMLAGLIHNIGALPVLTLAEEDPLLSNDATRLDRYIQAIAPVIGGYILKMWKFPLALQDVPVNAVHIDYDHDGPADYSDLVLVSRLQHLLGSEHPDAQRDWAKVPAFHRVGLAHDANVIEMEGNAEEISEVEQMLTSMA